MAQVPVESETREERDFRAAQEAAGAAVRAARAAAGRTLTDVEIRQASERGLIESDDPDVRRFGGVSGIALPVVPRRATVDFASFLELERRLGAFAFDFLRGAPFRERVQAVMDFRLDTMIDLFNLLLTELEERQGQALQNVAALLAQLRVDLASQLVTQQSETENRAQAQQELNEAAGEGGLFGFIGRIRDFVTSPFERLLTAIGEWFLGEVRDGLNR